MTRKSNQKAHKKKKEYLYYYLHLPKPLFFSQKLTYADKLVLIALLLHDNPINGCFPGTRRLAKVIGISEATVARARQHLEELGVLSTRLNRKEKNVLQYELPKISGSLEEQEQFLETLGYKLRDKRGYPLLDRRVSALRQEGIIPELIPSEKKVTEKALTKGTEDPILKGNDNKELKEINNNRHEVVLPLTLQSQIQEQTAHFQDTMKEWKLSSEELKSFDLLEILLWVGYIRSRISDSYKVPNPAGYLLSSLRNKDRKIEDREEKVGELMEEWIPEGLLVVHQNEYWFPRWRYLEELSQEHKKPVSDLLKEGILDDLTIKDEDRDEPLLDEFSPEEMKVLREGKFEERLLEHKKKLAEQEAQVKEIKEWREKPEEFFAEVVKPMMEGGERL